MVLNKSLQVCGSFADLQLVLADDNQEINVQNMNVELVAQMFKNYQSNVLFHLEGMAYSTAGVCFSVRMLNPLSATDSLKEPS